MIYMSSRFNVQHGIYPYIYIYSLYSEMMMFKEIRVFSLSLLGLNQCKLNLSIYPYPFWLFKKNEIVEMLLSFIVSLIIDH